MLQQVAWRVYPMCTHFGAPSVVRFPPSSPYMGHRLAQRRSAVAAERVVGGHNGCAVGACVPALDDLLAEHLVVDGPLVVEGVEALGGLGSVGVDREPVAGVLDRHAPSEV